MQYSITVKAGFNAKLAATNIVLRIPTPLNATTAVCKTVIGKAKYVPAENLITWKCVVLSPLEPNCPPFLFSSFCISVRMKLMSVDDRIARLQGQTEATLTAVADLSSTTHRQPWARPPIDVDFQVLMFTASGLLVRFLKVYERSGYQSVKWVRYLTRAQGTYQIRVSTHTCV